MIKLYYDANYIKHAKSTIEGKIWEIVEIGKENVKNNEVLDGVTNCYSAEYSSHVIAEVINDVKMHYWKLVTGYSIGKLKINKIIM